MKAVRFGDSLREFALFMEESGCVHGAQDLKDLAVGFDLGGTLTVANVVKKTLQYWKTNRRVARYPSQLKARLDRLASALKLAGATPAAKDFSAALTLFSGRGDEDVRGFVHDMNLALQAPKKVSKAKTKTVDVAATRAFADRLTAASTDNAKFDAVVDELKALDRKISSAELTAIANRYLGRERKYKSKDDIFKAITTRQLQDALQASRDRRLERIAV